MMRLVWSLPTPAGILTWLHDNPGHTPIVPWAVSVPEMEELGLTGFPSQG
jgi:hypothetical protein